MGLSPSGKLTYGAPGEGDDITEALAAAAEAVPLDVEPGESQAEDAEAAPPSRPASEEPSKTEPKAAPAPEIDKTRASDWATLHRERKEFFAQKQEQKAQLAEAERIKAILANAKDDRLAALEAMGYTDIKEFIEGLAQDGGRVTPERRELNELKAWRKQQEAAAEEQRAQAAQQHEQQLRQGKLDALREQIRDQLKSEQYAETIVNLKNADEQVMLEMDRMATATGQMPDRAEAIENVRGRFQEYLEEMAENPAIRAFFAEKLNSRQSPQAVSPQSKQRAKVRTIGGNTPSPGLKNPEPSRASGDLSDDVEEAIRGLASMARG